jgi:hypothetical protein
MLLQTDQMNLPRDLTTDQPKDQGRERVGAEWGAILPFSHRKK